MWIGDFFRKHSFVLIAFTLIASPTYAKPRARSFLLASAFICAGTFAGTAFLLPEPPKDVQLAGSHQLTEVANVEPLRVALLAGDERSASFTIVGPAGEAPFIKVFDKNRIQRLYASRILSTIREKVDDPDLRALIPQTDYLQVEFRDLRIEKRDGDKAELILTAGPVPMELRQTVPLADLESGHWVNIRFGDFVVEHDAANVVATVRIKLRYVGDTGDFELGNIQGNVDVAALFGKESDTGTVDGGKAERVDP